MPRHPSVYAEMLGERLDRHDVPVWLVNTGWTGGPYGVGRADEHPAGRGKWSAPRSTARSTACRRGTDPIFGFEVPVSCPGVPAEVLWPRDTWADRDAYDAQARKLASMFVENFKQFEDRVSDGVRAAGPRPPDRQRLD